jgi:uncharacterized membrane protein YhiD involved in acid resistance
MAAGAGFYTAAVITTGVVLVGLGPLRWVEGGRLARLGRGGRTLEIDLAREHPVTAALAVIDASTAKVNRVEFEDEREGRFLRVELEVPFPAEERLVDDLASLEGVRGVRWAE